MKSKILNRILRQIEIPDLIEILSEKLTPTDRQTLMLELYKRCAEKVSPSELLPQYQKNRFTVPSGLSPEKALNFDLVAFEIAKKFDFETIELSPLAPLGSCAAVGTVSQNKIVSTVRNTEALSDPTNLMALECAKRRQAFLKENPKSPHWIQLCASARAVRAQALADPKHFAHFRLFSVVTAGRDSGNYLFESESLKNQIEFWLTLLNSKKHELEFSNIKVKLTDLSKGILKPKIEKLLFEPLKLKFKNVIFEFDDEREAGRGYYKNVCFKIDTVNQKGWTFPLADGGFTDWTQKILNNKKERLLISGFGSELACLHFQKP